MRYKAVRVLYRPVHFVVKWDEFAFRHGLYSYPAAGLCMKRIDARNNEAVVAAAFWL
jgi:hypothetical protein